MKPSQWFYRLNMDCDCLISKEAIKQFIPLTVVVFLMECKTDSLLEHQLMVLDVEWILILVVSAQLHQFVAQPPVTFPFLAVAGHCCGPQVWQV